MFKFTNNIFWAGFSLFWSVFCLFFAIIYFDSGWFWFYVVLGMIHAYITWLRMKMYYDSK